MLTTIDTSTFNGLNVYASFCVEFSSFFGPEELTWDKWDPNNLHLTYVTRKLIKFTPNDVIIHLQKSKIDQYSEGINFTLSYADDAFCLVKVPF